MKKGLKGLAVWVLPVLLAGGLFATGCQQNSAVNPILNQGGVGAQQAAAFGRLFLSTTGPTVGANDPAQVTNGVITATEDSATIFANASAANNTLINGVLTVP